MRTIAQRRVRRHMVASVYFLYFELGGLASDGGRVITEAEWSVLFRSSLISASERKVLERFRGSRFFLMQSWALRLAVEQMAKPDKVRPPPRACWRASSLHARDDCRDETGLLRGSATG